MKRNIRLLAALTLVGFVGATAQTALSAGFSQVAGGGRGGAEYGDRRGGDRHEGGRNDNRHGDGWRDGRGDERRHEWHGGHWERHGYAPRYYVPVRGWGRGGGGHTVVVDRHHNDGIFIIGSALVGGLIGYAIGRSSEHADDRNASAALETNRTGERSTWVNPDGQSQVSVTPVRTYRNSSEEYCREYTTEVRVGGQTQSAYGTACREPDGSWRIVE